jgi:hypothetical protein
MAKSPSDFLTFERIGIEGGERPMRTSYVCLIKSILIGNVVELTARIELPHTDKKLSEIEHDIAAAIHEATNPARLSQRSL